MCMTRFRPFIGTSCNLSGLCYFEKETQPSGFSLGLRTGLKVRKVVPETAGTDQMHSGSEIAVLRERPTPLPSVP